MARKAAGRKGGKPAGVDVAKVTLRLTVRTARRLGVQAVMSGRSQSDIAEDILAAHLTIRRLPYDGPDTPSPGSGRGDAAEDAA